MKAFFLIRCWCQILDFLVPGNPVYEWMQRCTTQHDRKRILYSPNSVIVSFYHQPTSMSSKCVWWPKPPITLPLSCLRVQIDLSSLWRDTAAANLLLASPFTSRNRKDPQAKETTKAFIASDTIQAFCREPNWYNDYTEEHLKERGWNNLRELKSEGSSWRL